MSRLFSVLAFCLLLTATAQRQARSYEVVGGTLNDGDTLELTTLKVNTTLP